MTVPTAEETAEELPAGTDIPEEVAEVEPAEAETSEEEVEEEVEEEEPAGAETPEEEEMVPKSVVEKMQKRFTKRLGHEVAKNKEKEEVFEKLGISLDTKPPRPRRNEYKDEYDEVDGDAFDAAIEKYDVQLLEWNDGKNARKQTETQAEGENTERLVAFHEAAEPLRVKYPDFDEVLNEATFGLDLMDILLDEKLTDVAYYLAKNRDENVRISQLAVKNPLQATREIGKLEAKVSRTNKGTSGAPPPINPISTDSTSIEVDESKLSDDDWYKRERKRDLEKLKKKFG